MECPSTNPTDITTCGAHTNQTLNGAGSVFPECDLNPSVECVTPGPPYNSNAVHITRVSDAVTDTGCSHGGAGCSYHAQPSGGAGDVVWDSTDTRFVVTQQGQCEEVYSFDPNPASPTYLAATKLYGTACYPAATAAFSKITNHLLYILVDAAAITGLGAHGSDYVIIAIDLTSTVTQPTVANGKITVLADLNTLSHCIPGGYTNQGQSVLSVSDDDQTFGMAIGPQDLAFYVAIWNQSLGCSVWETDTGVVTKFSGSTGTITDQSAGAGVPVKFLIHEAQIFHDGGKISVEGESCVAGNTCNTGGAGNVFLYWNWETGVPYSGHPSPTGLTTYPVGQNNYCGHTMQGWNEKVNKCILDNTSAMQYWKRNTDGSSSSLLDPSAPTSTCYPLGSSSATVCPNGDQHISWGNNTDGTDTAPFTSINYAQFSPTPSASLVPTVPTFYWDNEILMWPNSCWPSCTSANTAYRVAHTYSDPNITPQFDDYIAIGSISPNPVFGQYFVLFTSNWQGQLGCIDGTYSASTDGLGCPGGRAGRRYDTFIATVPVGGMTSAGVQVGPGVKISTGVVVK